MCCTPQPISEYSGLPDVADPSAGAPLPLHRQRAPWQIHGQRLVQQLAQPDATHRLRILRDSPDPLDRAAGRLGAAMRLRILAEMDATTRLNLADAGINAAPRLRRGSRVEPRGLRAPRSR